MSTEDGTVSEQVAAPSGVSSRAARSVAIAGAVVALSGFLVQAVATGLLTETETAQFLTYWSMLFAAAGIVGGVQHEITRSVAAVSHRPDGVDPAPPGARVLPVALGLGVLVAAVLALSSGWWGSRIVPTGTATAVALILVGTVAFSGHAAVVGALAGEGRWSLYSRVVGAEALVRLGAVGGVIAMGATLLGYEIASAVAMFTWLLAALLSRRVRSVLLVRADAPLGVLVRRCSHALVAAVSMTVLVVGYPVLLGLTTSPAEYAGSAALLLGLSLTRAPLLLPINAFQGMAIHYFVGAGDARLRALFRLLALVLAAGVLGAGLAWAVGPWLLHVITTRELGGGMLAALTFAAAMLAGLTLSGTVTIAVGRHRDYSIGWLVATVTAVAILLLPLPLEPRLVMSLVLGPLLGATWHVAAVRRAGTANVGVGGSLVDGSEED